MELRSFSATALNFVFWDKNYRKLSAFHSCRNWKCRHTVALCRRRSSVSHDIRSTGIRPSEPTDW